jgi:hypothetical protein
MWRHTMITCVLVAGLLIGAACPVMADEDYIADDETKKK